MSELLTHIVIWAHEGETLDAHHRVDRLGTANIAIGPPDRRVYLRFSDCASIEAFIAELRAAQRDLADHLTPAPVGVR